MDSPIFLGVCWFVGLVFWLSVQVRALLVADADSRAQSDATIPLRFTYVNGRNNYGTRVHAANPLSHTCDYTFAQASLTPHLCAAYEVQNQKLQLKTIHLVIFLRF